MIDITSAVRQGIAFIFFGLMLSVLFTKEVSPKLKKIYFIIFGASMIVSHYSTSYIALTLFTLTYFFIIIDKIYKNKQVKKRNFPSSQKLEVCLTGGLILLLLLFGSLWYNQVTPTSNGLIKFLDKSFGNFNNLFNQDFQIEGHSFLDQFKLKPENKDYNVLINEQIIEIQNTTKDSTGFYSNITNTFVQFLPSEIIHSKIPNKIISLFYNFINIIKKLGYIFIFVGLIYSIIHSKINKKQDLFLISFMGIIFFSFIVLLTLVPFGSVLYGVLRLYQQGLILFSVFGIIGLFLIFNKVDKKRKFIFIWLFLITYFLFFTGFFNQIIGGNSAFLNLNNFGGDYDAKDISNTEIIAISWMSNVGIKGQIYASEVYKNPLQTIGELSSPNEYIFPQVLKKNSYVYAGNSEVFNKIAFIYIQGSQVGYKFPIEFLNKNKNEIYNNGGSKLFK
jgi:uncharacterized membrane protein